MKRPGMFWVAIIFIGIAVYIGDVLGFVLWTMLAYAWRNPPKKNNRRGGGGPRYGT